MLQTLFYIPTHFPNGWPVFGFGVLLAIWTLGSLAFLAWLVRRQGWNSDTLGYVPVAVLVGLAIAFLLPAISKPEGLPIRGYGMMLLVAVVCGVALSVHRARQMGVDQEIILALAMWLFVGGIVGARLFFVIEYWDEFRDESDSLPTFVGKVLSINEGGLVVYGSLIGAVLAMVLFVRKHHLPLLALGDLVIPSFALGQAIGRIGCLLNGCCFGGLCALPWSITFPAQPTAVHDSPPHLQQVELGQVYGMLIVAAKDEPPTIGAVEAESPAAAAGVRRDAIVRSINGERVETLAQAQSALVRAFFSGEQLSLETDDGMHRMLPLAGTRERSRPVHPTQIYSFIDAGLLSLFLLAYYPFRRRDGEVLALGLTIHPIMRFLLEVIRTDEGAVFGTGLSISQNVSLLLLVGVAGLWYYILRQPRGTVWPAATAA